MKTLFLGSYGYGNLGDELCLIEALSSFPSTESYAFSNDPEFTGSGVSGLSGFIQKRVDIQTIKPERVVLGGGGVGFFPSIRDMLHWMDDAFRMGAECHIHNIGVAHISDLSWTNSAEVKRVLEGLKSFSVRDHISWFCSRMWSQAAQPSISFYPERNLPVDNALVGLLPSGRKLLGISITGQQLMRDALLNNPDRVNRELDRFQDYLIVPIISTVSKADPEEDDIAGFNYFRDLYLKDRDIAPEIFLDKDWWRANYTPLRLKGVIGALDCIFTQRKHNLIHAIGTNVPAVGIFPSIDDSLARIFYSLRDYIPFGSQQCSLPVKP